MKSLCVLENKNGDVVRQIRLEADAAELIYRNDLRRIEVVNDLSDLDEKEISYTLIAHITASSLTNKIKVGDHGFLRLATSDDKVGSNIEFIQDDETEMKNSLKYTAAFAASLVLLFVLGLIFSQTPQMSVQEVVVVPKQETVEPVVEPVKEKKIAVAPNKNKTKHTEQKIAHHTKLQKVAKRQQVVAQKSQNRVAARAKQPALNSQGALAVLGSMKNSKDAGGIKVSASQTTRGVGLGGTAGSGGMQTSFYGKGLTSAPLGAGSRAEGGGGYGSHGKGGGQAGYGKMTLVGANGGYFQPVISEADVEGGLDQDEINQVILRHMGQVRFCYEQGLQSSEKLSGRVSVHFLIGNAGSVNEADIAGTSMHSSGVENCLLAKLKSWKFPKPRGGAIVKVVYPFVLKRMSNT
jgi:outer membrane biosynthesis protein TonB